MAEKPKLKAALDTVLELTYPPTTLTISTSKAAGHRLAKPIIAKGNQPSRPVAMVDGLAVISADITSVAMPGTDPGDEHDIGDGEESLQTGAGPEFRDGEDAGDAGGQAPVAADDLALEPDDAGEQADDGQREAWDSADQTVRLKLRPFPASNRREEALEPGEAIAIPVGGEVPRGGECVFPLSMLVPEPAAGEDEPVEPVAPVEVDNGNGEEDDLPVAEPPRSWDLPGQFTSGEVEVPTFASRLPRNMIPIGGWARNREVLLPDKTVLRAAEMSMLAALGIDEVTIYRRPVVGVVSLGSPFPNAGRQSERSEQPGVCPLSTLAVSLARAARVAALPLGYAPSRFHLLTAAVERWIQQVDILLLVGGSHHGPSCRGLDVLKTSGKVQLSGMDLEPGGTISSGKISGQPVIVIPGGLPDVLSSLVLIVRPLMHKYLLPHNYEDRIELRLENGSRLQADHDTAVPVRFGYDRDAGIFTSRYSGRPAESWLDFIRGQALIVIEAGRSYSDGEFVTAWKY